MTGKKLLILGGNAPSIDVVEAAKSLGVYTIVADYYDVQRSPAKLVADEMWNDDIFDTPAIIEKIKANKIDGVITGFTDSYLLQYQRICEQAGLPCYATKEVFELTMDKARFKQLCRENGVSVIPEYKLEEFDPQTISEINKVIIKPVDNSGSRGVILCQRPEDFESSLKYALSFSEKKKVVIEKYMEMDSISVSYTMQDGKASLSTTDDRYVHKSLSGSSVTCMGLYPSKYTEAYLNTLDGKVRAMYEKAGLKNGVLAIQFFTDGKDFYVMEMGHRLSGGQHYTYTKHENGISALEQLIHFSVTGRMADFCIAEKDNALFKNTYCHLFLLGREGAKIAKIEGFEQLEKMPEMLHAALMKNTGDVIGTDGTAAQKMAGLHLKVKDINHLQDVLVHIRECFHVYDTEGNDIVLELGK